MNETTLSERRFFGFLIGLLLLISFGGIVDLILDRPASYFTAHVLFEAAFVLLCLGAVVVLWNGWLRAARSVQKISLALEAHRSERDEWRKRAQHFLQGLGTEIDHQFSKWNLTEAERETALMLLKGYSHQEIAELAGKSEKTVRQQSSVVYRKSGLAGRAELAAFFLEDLLLPVATTGTQKSASTKDAPSPHSAALQ